jgi:hypothetical protein
MHIIMHKFWKKSQLLKYVVKNHLCHDHNLNLQLALEMNNKMSISILKQIKGFQVEIGLQCTKTWNKCKIMWTYSHMKWKCARIKEVILRLSSQFDMLKVENIHMVIWGSNHFKINWSLIWWGYFVKRKSWKFWPFEKLSKNISHVFNYP